MIDAFKGQNSVVQGLVRDGTVCAPNIDGRIVSQSPESFTGTITLEEIEAEARRQILAAELVETDSGLFLVKSASEWLEQAKSQPVPQMLFSIFWHQGELSILFADTNIGKSILAVQIGQSIASGLAIPGFEMQAGSQKVLYFDFEMSVKQFEGRYSLNYADHFPFSESFIRAEIDPDSGIPDSFPDFESYLNQSLEFSIKKTGARILIIDNLTYLRNETERAKDAMPLMKNLKALKSKYGLSILALAHTPKRDYSKPLTGNDLQGSKMLLNFCDSAFAIGASNQDRDFRYIKQIKARSTAIEFDGSNVCVCRVEKPSNFLQFRFIDFASEKEHLRILGDDQRDERVEKAKFLSQQGKTQREIAVEMNLSAATVNRLLKP